jgi:spermidine/putrescine transport system ATP-binding protein
MREGTIEQEGPPAEVYDRPVSRFSAAFLGAANLIAGERVEQGVRTALGVLRCPLPAGWQRGWLAIRPERIDPGEGENAVRVGITDVIYRGDHVDCYASAGGEGLRLRLPPDEAPRPGDTLAVRLPADWLVPLHG